MSAASVIACRSPTILRNCSISSGASGGGAHLLIFMSSSLALIVLRMILSENRNHTFPDHALPRDSSPAQPVVDRFAQTFFRDRHHRDRPGPLRIERAKIAEQIGGGL